MAKILDNITITMVHFLPFRPDKVIALKSALWVHPFEASKRTIEADFAFLAPTPSYAKKRLLVQTQCCPAVVLTRHEPYHFVTYVLPPPLKSSPLALPR